MNYECKGRYVKGVALPLAIAAIAALAVVGVVWFATGGKDKKQPPQKSTSEVVGPSPQAPTVETPVLSSTPEEGAEAPPEEEVATPSSGEETAPAAGENGKKKSVIGSIITALSVGNKLAGFTGGPKTYLVLFLNNTEMRPVGGFIGSYATVTVDKGIFKNLSVAGSEEVGVKAAASAFPDAPAPLAALNGTRRWRFKDANWSPEFKTSASRALELYKKQSGDARTFDGVIGITPEVLRAVLELTGPVTVSGIEFTPENALDKLQSEIERGYLARGLKAKDRKKILKELADVLVRKLAAQAITNFGELTETYRSILAGGHFLVAMLDEKLQSEVVRLGWNGAITSTSVDYLMVLDSAFNSLKTDPAVNRTITYKVTKEKAGWVAEAKIVYQHTKAADWRTTRYKTYTRLLVPKGSRLLSGTGWTPLKKGASADVGEEHGKTSFGGQFTVAPQSKHTLTVKYALPASVAEKLESGTYELYAEKQLGAYPRTLKLDLNFAAPVTSATPSGVLQNDGKKYTAEVVWDVDRQFTVSLK